MRLLNALILCGSLFWGSTSASIAFQGKTNNNLDVRIGMPTPKNLLDMKDHSVDLWIKSRQSNIQVFRYVNEVAELRAYLFVCKRHDLNLKMSRLAQLASRYLQAVVPAQYDEPELQLLETFTKPEQQAFLEDMAEDIYAFEFGMRVAMQDQRISDSGKTKKSFCDTIENEYFRAYVALLATANRELAEE
tara:strand:+ start:135 stop:704 length:570 start_codon:yes stop_codon:yes gene_type:complete